jgi:hypothetical protein
MEDLAATLKRIPLRDYARLVDRDVTEIRQHLAILCVHIGDVHSKLPEIDLAEILRAMHRHVEDCRW